MSDKRIGHAVVVLLILAFIISGISLFFNEADAITGVNSGKLSSSFTSFDNNLSGVKSLEAGFTSKTDNSSTFSVDDPDSQIEQRGSDSSGFINILSKNILTRFFMQVSRDVPGSTKTIIFILSLIGVICSVLLLRFFWGEHKI